ncbi:MAG: hypothetical protein ABGY43_10270 [bacterium]|jgi:hypothetical protein
MGDTPNKVGKGLNPKRRQAQRAYKSKDVDVITSILYNPTNTNMNFVQRIKNPSVYPVMDYGKDSKGNKMIATHQMSVSESNGTHYAYPNIVQKKGKRELEQLGDNEAFNYAIRNNEAIGFTNHKDALWFSKNYKKYWGH